MIHPTLHYYYDPLCGWCYAAEPLVQAAAAAAFPVVLHGGGLWDPAGRVPDAKRAQIKVADRRIHAMTGQVFGAAYLDGLLDDPAAVFHSRPTIAAVLAAERLDAGADLPMLAALQRAHYIDGRRIVERSVLVDLARELALDADAFAAALDAVPVDEHIRTTRVEMHRHGLHGYPAFLLERDGTVARLAHEGCYGDPHAFVALVTGTCDERRRAAG